MKRLIKILPLTLWVLAATASGQDVHGDSAAPRYDFSVEDAPARAFFEGLVVGTPVNMLVHPDVKGRVSLSLKQVTLEEALEAVRDLYGYDYRPLANGYVIMAPAAQTRVFQLNYLDLQRIGVSRTRVSSGQVSQGSSSSNEGQGGSDDEKTQTSSTTGTAVLTRNESDFWKGIETDIALLVSGDVKNSVVINRQSGVVMVRAFPEALRAVGAYLRKTQSTITRQVVLEAKVIEVELNSGFQAGINWTALVTKGNKTAAFGQSTPPGGFGANPFSPTGTDVVVAPGNPIVGQVVDALGGAFTFAFDSTDFSAFIELLDAQGRTRVLSSPRVSTLHNQKAIIKAGTDEFFVTGVSSDTTTGESTTTSLDVELTPFFSGVALDVTPQISDDGTVLMHIHPTVSDVQDQSKRISFGGSTSDLPLAVSQIRESDSVVRARSGQVIVIGGLMRETRQRDDYKTPFLGNVPGIGNLFKSKRDLSNTVELVLLLRPVVVEDSDWDGMVRETTDRAAALSKKGDVEGVR
ncbi:MAG TPA: pilus (MSHA type) biogenesis protein MshL [Steroidobacteraceae bacterium]|nr:pilus (MSHA type) biogenesis protein MshL [Steroidobacteraceae bacterium]